MNVTPAPPPAYSSSLSGGDRAPDTQAPSPLSADFETFLRMLTVQMTNQDPLNPLESSDYAVQLATFSGVEQQVITNDLLASVAARLAGTDMSQLATLIGLEARADVPAYFDGAPVNLSVPLSTGTDDSRLVVRDDAGSIIQSLQIPVGEDNAQWAGVDDQGDPYPVGHYSFEVEHYTQGNLMVTNKVQTYSRVVEARIENGESILVFAGGNAVYGHAVTAMRDPG